MRALLEMRVPGAAQHLLVVRCRPGTPVSSLQIQQPGSRISGAPLRKSSALHRVRDTS
jgi:hypothetical protein